MPTMADLIYGSQVGLMLGGQNQMANLGNQIGNAFDISNLLSSGNRRAEYGPRYDYQSQVDTNRSQERIAGTRAAMQQNVLNSILPALMGMVGGAGGGYRTDYGGGTGGYSQARPTQMPAGPQSIDQILARMQGVR